ncbi:zinc-ribbon domain-containing protein [Halobellus salinus]
MRFLQAAASSRPSCGHDLAGGENFCPECGTDIAAD